MGQKTCQPECYDCCLKNHNAMLLQLEHMIAQTRSNRQAFMAYLLGMASCELRSIIDRALQEALLQQPQNSRPYSCKQKTYGLKDIRKDVQSDGLQLKPD